MPDWSYATVSGPLLRRGSHERGRRFVNGFFGLLGRIPKGYWLVDLLGHMDPHGAQSRALPTGVELSSSLILSPCIDPEGGARTAFSRFGCGALTFGPVALEGRAHPTFRQAEGEAIVGTGGAALGLMAAAALTDVTGSAKYFFELDPFEDDPLGALDTLTSTLGPRAAGFVLTAQRHDALLALAADERAALLDAFAEACHAHEAVGFLGLPTDAGEDALELASAHGLAVCIAGGAHDEGWRWGGEDQREAALSLTEAASERELFTLVEGGVRSPREALALRAAGADLIALGPGLVHVGPGLAKRINETFVFMDTRAAERHQRIFDEENPVRRPWTWATALGLSMLVGALIAGWSAMTVVILPYDEEFLGRTALEIKQFNPRVLEFMTHDRITLAGTMVSIGVLYTALATFVMRKGYDWGQHVVGASATLGCLSFFAFLGFGYFDPFHAFVTAVLLQLLIQVIVLPVGPKRGLTACPRLDNDAVWRRAMWSQLLFVLHGGALVLAGVTILAFGMSVVFVPQDIAFLGCDVNTIEAFDPQLKALIAHDRATFGGMLVSGGVALLLTSLWSFRQGDRWLLWTYVATIATPYALTLWIHYRIGYDDRFHLAPVYIGLVLLVAGVALGARYLTTRERPLGAGA